MPKGSYTIEDAMKGGRIPAAPVGRAINQWVREQWWMDLEASVTGHWDSDGATERLAKFVGLSGDTIMRLRYGRKDWIEFDNADRIITFIDPWLWRTDPALSRIYRTFRFAHLDTLRPTCAAADPLNRVEGLTAPQAARKLGVSLNTIYKRRARRAAEVEVAA